LSTQETNLKAIADAIREKDGTTAAIPASEFPNRIRAIQMGVDTSDATAAASDILSAKTAYIASGKVTGSMPTKSQATPSISVSSSGLITASAIQETGYVKGGTKRATKQLSTQPAATIIPGASSQTAVYSGRYTTGSVTVAGDTNLKAANIKSGVSIFGVAGSYEGGSVSANPDLSISNLNVAVYDFSSNYISSNNANIDVARSKIFGISFSLKYRSFSELSSLASSIPWGGYGITGVSAALVDGNILAITLSRVDNDGIHETLMYGSSSQEGGTFVFSGNGRYQINYTPGTNSILLGSSCFDWSIFYYYKK